MVETFFQCDFEDAADLLRDRFEFPHPDVLDQSYEDFQTDDPLFIEYSITDTKILVSGREEDAKSNCDWWKVFLAVSVPAALLLILLENVPYMIHMT